MQAVNITVNLRSLYAVTYIAFALSTAYPPDLFQLQDAQSLGLMVFSVINTVANRILAFVIVSDWPMIQTVPDVMHATAEHRLTGMTKCNCCILKSYLHYTLKSVLGVGARQSPPDC